MVTLLGNQLMETKSWATDKDGIGRILIPRVMAEASTLTKGQQYQIIYNIKLDEYTIKPINEKWTMNKQKG